ncbi:2-phospho-L-lactate guanylyltransferase [Pseudonocardia parietis]|uniref:Phosphoenolpyruvate guanylyltransferase n=1 Tax=Pseudonocardia parietis TaxID=570936 RepID=A0ABS4VRD0_9PSEU|nr:2-phospho-L-lactate guanylyltransferase [Pseudonocardia parietis]MBP2366326.1 2-phospho-L-lactate guanylyltransferase [Pseudonocardia parietis]
MTLRVDLVVPVKPLPKAKTRLRGAADGGVGDLGAHLRLALALARDTVHAALSAEAVRNVVVISSDPAVAMEVGPLGAEVVTDPGRGLNGALRHGAALLRSRDGGTAIGALQADLPALRPADLDDAVVHAAALFATGVHRVFQPDEPGTGTTMLLAAPGLDLDPHFGGASAAAHRSSGAVVLPGDRPGLRRDVDTAADLEAALALGVGAWTRAVIDARDRLPRSGTGPGTGGPVVCPKV